MVVFCRLSFLSLVRSWRRPCAANLPQSVLLSQLGLMAPLCCSEIRETMIFDEGMGARRVATKVPSDVFLDVNL